MMLVSFNSVTKSQTVFSKIWVFGIKFNFWLQLWYDSLMLQDNSWRCFCYIFVHIIEKQRLLAHWNVWKFFKSLINPTIVKSVLMLASCAYRINTRTHFKLFCTTLLEFVQKGFSSWPKLVICVFSVKFCYVFQIRFFATSLLDKSLYS